MEIFIALLAFILLMGGIAYLIYRQGNLGLKAQQDLADSTKELVVLQAEQAAPHSPSGGITHPNLSKGGPLGNRQITLLAHNCLLQPVLDVISGLTDSFTVLFSLEEVGDPAEKEKWMKKSSKEELYEITYKGTKLRMSFNSRLVKTVELINDNYKPSDAPETRIGYNFQIVLPMSEDPGVKEAMIEIYDQFMDVLKLSKVSFDNSTGGNLQSIYHVVLNGLQADLDQRMGQTISVVPKQLINASYAPLPELIVNGVKYKDVPMGDRIVQEFRPALEDGKNIAIIGATGTGKTQLINAIVAGMDCNLLFLNATSLDYVVKNPTLLDQAKIDGKLIVAFDEAQSLDPASLHALLQLMEGNQKSEGVSFILGLNTETPDPALIRPGRIDYLVKLTQLSKTAARNICKTYTDIHPEIETDQAKLNTMLIPEPNFTLADVYSCLGKASKMKQLHKAYSTYAVQQPKK